MDNNIILAIETATSACSVALGVGEKTYSLSEIGKNIHSQVLLKMVQSVLEQSRTTSQQVDAVAVSQGPGSFTGLRIGIGVAQGFAYGTNCPMIGISSLDALALQSTVDGSLIAALDARMGEVYWGEYLKQGNSISRQGQIQLTKPSQIPADAEKKYALVGNPWLEYLEQFNDLLQVEQNWQKAIVYPSAEAMLHLARLKFSSLDWVSPIDFAPLYVRNNIAKKMPSG